MMNFRVSIRRLVSSLALTIMVGLALAPALTGPASAACDSSNLTISGGISCGAPASSSTTSLFGGSGSLFQRLANTLIFIVGAISVIMVIIGGLRYVLSAGSPQATNGAKDTILYAVIGVVVAGLAFAIVNFVVGRF
ncbi:MAG TPA: hypothetical protein VLE72_03595 [Candidatus Saccharimonadales bacterium]|nr:hypothetical protein [Candidatus Saccharimonadales bacterium]